MHRATRNARLQAYPHRARAARLHSKNGTRLARLSRQRVLRVASRRTLVASKGPEPRRARLDGRRIAALPRKPYLQREILLAQRRRLDVRADGAARWSTWAATTPSLPLGSVEGRQAWIETAGQDGMPIAAVLVGSVATLAHHGSGLHCWNQDVLYAEGRGRWGNALVCDGNIEADGVQASWFKAYR